MSMRARILVALSACVTPSACLRQKISTTSAGGQVVLLSSGTKTASNLDALDKMSAAADENSGVVRFDTYEEMLKPTPSITFPAMKLFTYTVFKDQTSLRAWKRSMGQYLHNFDSDELAFSQPGLETETANEITPQTEANPIFFWAYVDYADFTTMRDAFAKINVPTRDEPGSIRYENSCTQSRFRREGRPFCFENVWYDTLPSAQDAHMSTAHMGVFFGDTAGVVIEWGMSTLKLLSTQAPSSVMKPLPVPQSSDAVNPVMHYMGVGVIDEISTSLQPQCMAANKFAEEDIGTKMPDSCCDIDSWGVDAASRPPSFFHNAPDVLTKPGASKYSRCYVRVAPWPFNGDATPPDYNGKWIRNYIGCENGKLVANEECVPSDVTMITSDAYTSDSYDYPMTEKVGMTHFEDGTWESCHCSPQAHFDEGPGCYIAYATLAQLGGSNPAVFVKVDGTCPSDNL